MYRQDCLFIKQERFQFAFAFGEFSTPKQEYLKYANYLQSEKPIITLF
jgi:hypothetical protein